MKIYTVCKIEFVPNFIGETNWAKIEVIESYTDRDLAFDVLKGYLIHETDKIKFTVQENELFKSGW